jgi:3',5'-cyclic AMP phosphodiesterase CpdA
VHLSDLHFGRLDPNVVDPLVRRVRAFRPDVVAISGDLTQRARFREFHEARNFLAALPTPQIIVPGNHDVPLYNLYARFIRPLQRYRSQITMEMEPFFADQEIAVIGVNTSRSLTFKGGRINQDQVNRLQERLCGFAPEVTKIVVSHHPFDLPARYPARALVGRARMAVQSLAECGADVFLAGHLHISHAGHTAVRYRIAGFSALVVQAGTATSTRGRGEANSFNVLRIEHPDIAVERLAWDPPRADFAIAGIERFRHTEEGWLPLQIPTATVTL